MFPKLAPAVDVLPNKPVAGCVPDAIVPKLNVPPVFEAFEFEKPPNPVAVGFAPKPVAACVAPKPVAACAVPKPVAACAAPKPVAACAAPKPVESVDPLKGWETDLEVLNQLLDKAVEVVPKIDEVVVVVVVVNGVTDVAVLSNKLKVPVVVGTAGLLKNKPLLAPPMFVFPNKLPKLI